VYADIKLTLHVDEKWISVFQAVAVRAIQKQSTRCMERPHALEMKDWIVGGKTGQFIVGE